ncbi:MAG TPA: hypothetical protein VJT49_26210 [Amycolatopsis sp.]|uniref:hypothetical protein n=1 Tax=Amycolatopsis sp. TaxID=37632 RepID=UPI002B4A431E|nr:hypothetical protein [Amycolatopsis sp.]HKS48542.1 hypothetical protein [Amycolatopsis sp.]
MSTGLPQVRAGKAAGGGTAGEFEVRFVVGGVAGADVVAGEFDALGGSLGCGFAAEIVAAAPPGISLPDWQPAAVARANGSVSNVANIRGLIPLLLPGSRINVPGR